MVSKHVWPPKSCFLTSVRAPFPVQAGCAFSALEQLEEVGFGLARLHGACNTDNALGKVWLMCADDSIESQLDKDFWKRAQLSSWLWIPEAKKQCRDKMKKMIVQYMKICCALRAGSSAQWRHKHAHVRLGWHECECRPAGKRGGRAIVLARYKSTGISLRAL